MPTSLSNTRQILFNVGLIDNKTGKIAQTTSALTLLGTPQMPVNDPSPLSKVLSDQDDPPTTTRLELNIILNLIFKVF